MLQAQARNQGGASP